MPGNPSAITTTRTVDAPLVQSATYRLDANDRQYIDNQIRGCEQHLATSLVNGTVSTWVLVDAGSVALAVGDVVCLASSTIGVPTVTKAVAAALAVAGSAYGMVLVAASPGSSALVAIFGVVVPSVSGLGAASGLVKVNTSTARATQTASFAGGDYPLGTVDAQGYVTLRPQTVFASGSYTPPTGTGFAHITSGAADGAARAVNVGSADVTGTLAVGNGGTGLTALGTGVVTFLGTPSGANLASALTSVLPATKVGPAGSTGQLQFNNAGALGGADMTYVSGTGYTIATNNTFLYGTDTVAATHIIAGIDNSNYYNYAGGYIQCRMGGDDFIVSTAYGQIMRGGSIVPLVLTDQNSGKTCGLFEYNCCLTANYTNSTTSATATNLSYAVVASETWDIVVEGLITTTTSGIKFQLTTPTGCTVNGFVMSCSTSAAAFTNIQFSSVNVLSSAVGTTAGTYFFRISLTLTVGVNGGTVALAAAGGAATANAILAGTKMTAKRSIPV